MKTKNKRQLLKQLETITDFRTDTHKIKYKLSEVLFMSLFGLLKGFVTFKDLHCWMKYNEQNELFKKLFKKTEIKIPSLSTLHNMLMNTDNNELEIVFREYFAPHVDMDNISIDGKWLKGSDVNGHYTQESHKSILNILDKDAKIVIGHKFLEQKKSSEIPATKEMLKDNFFSKEEQIFSFDALLTQIEILNDINKTKRRYIAKVKGNQEGLRDKAKKSIDTFDSPTDSYSPKTLTIEGNKIVKRVVDIYEDKNCNLVMFHSDFNNIQTIIKITKETSDEKTGEVSTTTQYLVANFKTTANDFHDLILHHWRIETYHYHLDMLTKEDDHISWINPFSISILRSFTINLYQLYLNAHKGEKILKSKITMAEIKRTCLHSDDFTSNIFESEL